MDPQRFYVLHLSHLYIKGNRKMVIESNLYRNIYCAPRLIDFSLKDPVTKAALLSPAASPKGAKGGGQDPKQRVSAVQEVVPLSPVQEVVPPGGGGVVPLGIAEARPLRLGTYRRS
jgi:hypothetical protein